MKLEHQLLLPNRAITTIAGIGYETAKALLQQNYNVTIACRDKNRATDAVSKLRAEVPGADVDWLQLDLADLQSVSRAANTWLDSGKQIDVLLNNAGVMACPRMTTADGFEYQLGVNHLGHFLWTKMLLPQMQQNPNPVRIINVSSAAHMFGKMDFADLQSERDYDRWRAYGKRAAATCCIALCQGAQTSIFLASSPDVEGITSKYYDNCSPITSSPASYNTETARKLWEVSEELTEQAVKARGTAAAAQPAVR
eukprot:gene4467-4723_t